jgi:Domain of unknown function (DUF6933)
MLVLRCTTKASKKLSHKPQAIEVSQADVNLGEWYVNTIDYLNAADLILACMHTESLFIMMVPLQPGMNGSGFAHAFHANLLARLMELEIPRETAGRIVQAYGGSAVLAKNTDRKVAGHLNAALGDLDYLLDIPEQNLTDGRRINLARVEHRLNDTPRNCSSRNTIWPLETFWRCLIRLCPELPPRTTLSITAFRKFQPTENEDVLRKHLPTHLVSKLVAAFNGADALYTADELRTLASVCESDGDLAASLPEFAAEMHHLASFRLERLLDDEHA